MHRTYGAVLSTTALLIRMQDAVQCLLAEVTCLLLSLITALDIIKNQTCLLAVGLNSASPDSKKEKAKKEWLKAPDWSLFCDLSTWLSCRSACLFPGCLTLHKSGTKHIEVPRKSRTALALF